jgi:hypothetical protein
MDHGRVHFRHDRAGHPSCLSVTLPLVVSKSVSAPLEEMGTESWKPIVLDIKDLLSLHQLQVFSPNLQPRCRRLPDERKLQIVYALLLIDIVYLLGFKNSSIQSQIHRDVGTKSHGFQNSPLTLFKGIFSFRKITRLPNEASLRRSFHDIFGKGGR